MTTVTVTEPDEKLKRRRERLQARARRAEITHDQIAARFGCHRTLVVHFFHARRAPEGMEAAIEQMITEASA